MAILQPTPPSEIPDPSVINKTLRLIHKNVGRVLYPSENDISLAESLRASDFVQIEGKIWYSKQGVRIPLYSIDTGRDFVPKSIHIEGNYCFLQVSGTVLCMNLNRLQDALDGKTSVNTQLLFDVFPGIDVGDKKRKVAQKMMQKSIPMQKNVFPETLCIGSQHNGKISVQFGKFLATLDTFSMSSTVSCTSKEKIIGTIGAHSVIEKENGETCIKVGAMRSGEGEIQELVRSIWEIYVKGLDDNSHFQSDEIRVKISKNGRVFIEAYECSSICKDNKKDINQRLQNLKPIAPVLYTFDAGNITELYTIPKRLLKKVDKDDRSISIENGWHEGAYVFYTGVDGKKYIKVAKKLVPIHTVKLQEHQTTMEYYFSQGKMHSFLVAPSMKEKMRRKIHKSSLTNRIEKSKKIEKERTQLPGISAPNGGRVVSVGNQVYILVAHPQSSKKETIYMYNEKTQEYKNVLGGEYERNIMPEKDTRFMSRNFLPEESLTLSMADPVMEPFIQLGKEILFLPATFSIGLLEKGIRKFLSWEKSSVYFQAKESVKEMLLKWVETSKVPTKESVKEMLLKWMETLKVSTKESVKEMLLKWVETLKVSTKESVKEMLLKWRETSEVPTKDTRVSK